MNNSDIIELFSEILELTGNPYLIEIINKYKDDEKELYKALKQYTHGIVNEIYENEDGEEENQKSVNIKLIYLNGVIIDATNIARMELDCDYNSKKNKNDYYIRIVKKYPTPMEEEYIIPFDSEEERDKGYEILIGKLKLCKIYII